MNKNCLTVSFVLMLSSYSYNGSDSVKAQEVLESAENTVFTILCDNTSLSDSIIADNGFSCLIEAGDHKCLFDAGNNSDKFMRNVNTMGVDCSEINLVFISHVHDDHIGGLSDLLPECGRPALCMPVSYPRQEGESFGDQADRDYAAMLDQLRPFVSVIVQSQDLVNLGGHFYSTGVIDKRSYEQALIIPTSKGLIIITGCAHLGILEIVKHARESTKQDVYFVMGGFHSTGIDSTQAYIIVQELRSLTKLVGPCHCTGGMAEDIFRDVFKEDCIDIYAGLRLELDQGESE